MGILPIGIGLSGLIILNKEDSDMSRMKGKSVGVIDIQGDEYSIRITDHAFEQMYRRKITVDKVSDTIKALGEQKIQMLNGVGCEVIVVNKNARIAVVFGWEGRKIFVITVIDSAEVFKKKGTLIQRV